VGLACSSSLSLSLCVRHCLVARFDFSGLKSEKKARTL